MKVAKFLAVFAVLLVVGIYVIAFTGFGNSLVRPIVEEQIRKSSGLDVELKRFHLSMSDLDVVLYITQSNAVQVKGEYSLFTQSFDLTYDVRFSKLKELRSIVKRNINGSFFTDGTIKGDASFVTIEGKSDVAKSDTTYHVELTEFNPTSIIAHLKQLDVESLLYIAGEPKYASAKLDIDLNFKNIKPHQLDGDVTLHSRNGELNKTVIAKYLGVHIPATTFSMDANAKLQKEKVAYEYLFDSNLAKLTTSGWLVPQPLRADILFDAKVKELALLKPLTGADVRGALNLNGTLKGDRQNMKLDLKSDIASSKTAIDVTLKELQPKALRAKIEHLRIEKLLYMLKQPTYASGVVGVQANLDSLDVKNLSGVVQSASTGSLNTAFLTKEYGFKHPMPKTSFRLKTQTNIAKSVAETKLTLASTLANLDVKKALFYINKGSLKSDYTLNVASLEKLYFVTDRHLRGGLTATGDITKDKDLLVTLHSDIAQGKLDVLLKNDDAHITLDDMRTKKLLWILYYPEIFDGGVNAQIDYNLALSKGVAKAQFKEGKFVHNQTFDLIKKFAKVDLYKEYFNGDAKANINKEKIAAIFDLQSRKARILSKKTDIDTKKRTIDSRITLTVKKTPVSVTLKGSMEKPKVGVDLKEFMKTEAGKKLEKKANKELEKLFKKLF